MKFRTLALAVGMMATGALCHAQKNVIVMIMDGGGFNQYAAGNIYLTGNTEGIYKNFPVKLAMSTYPYTTSDSPEGRRNGSYDPSKAWNSFAYLKTRPTDSAAAATAMACGVKTYNAAIGMDMAGKPVQNVIEAEMAMGKSGGVVTSVPLSHATPAGFSAHNAKRGNYAEIANEQIFRSKLNVIMGCGHPLYDDNGVKLEKPTNYDYVGGEESWKKIVKGDIPLKFIETRQQFQQLAAGKIRADRVLGIPQAASTLSSGRAGKSVVPFDVPIASSLPTLQEMTQGALTVLRQNKNGFALMVEGGAVDWACHSNDAPRAVEEAVMFDQTVESVMKWIEKNGGWKDNLLIVTADHETGYLWGTGSGKEGDDRPVFKPIVNNGKGKLPGMAFNYTSHTNSLVPIFAKGAGAERFNAYARLIDPVRGRYIDNTQIIKAILDR
ncbi:MAG: alkaline phosphatase [Armatimonadota bacterium]